MKFEWENNTGYLVMEENISGQLEEKVTENALEKYECNEIEYKMIQNNDVEGLLPMHQRVIDGNVTYYYDVTSKQQMTKLYNYVQLKLEDVAMICESISLMVRSINMYMLDLRKVIFEPEYMYVDISQKSIEFVYYPPRFQEENGCDNGIRKLFEYMLEHFDHSVEKEQLMVMYMIYQKVVQEEYNLENINELVKECSEEIEKGKIGHEELEVQEKMIDRIPINAVPAENIEDEVEVENENLIKCQRWVKMVSISIIILGILKILIPGVIPLPISMTVSAFMAVSGAAVFVAVGALPKHLFVKLQPRRCRKHYEVLREECNNTYKFECNDTQGEECNKNQYEEPQTMLLSDYIKAVADSGNSSEKVRLVARKSQESQGMREIQKMQESQGMCESYETQENRDVSGNCETAEILEIDKFPCIIGSMKERCDKVIPEKLISRIHCCISDCMEGYYIEDMNSTNGTFVNGERLAPNNRHILNQGDEVRLATYVYEVEIG